MRNLSKLVLLAVVLCWWGGSPRPALAWATCWCEIATAHGDGTYNTSLVSLTDKIGKSYNGCEGDGYGQECGANRDACGKLCNAQCVAGYMGFQNFANGLCAKGIANGTLVNCYSHVGVQGWQTNQTLGTLTNIDAVSNTVCTCPKPWFNNKNVLGGPTSGDQQCKIQVCGPITPGPGTSLPPNGTATNTWPTQWWTWENTLWQWAPVATCVTTEVSPAQCTLK